MTAQRTSIFHELDQVQVVRLHHAARKVGGTERVRRQPRVGDRGTVVALLQRGSDAPGYYVECVDDDGLTVWLTEFDRDELAPVPERAA
jgi:predicted extracellular nuclease